MAESKETEEEESTYDQEKQDLEDHLKTFDYAAANPPFSGKRWSPGLDPENDPFQQLLALAGFLLKTVDTSSDQGRFCISSQSSLTVT